MEIKYRNNSITTNKDIKKTAYYTIGSFSFYRKFRSFYIELHKLLHKIKTLPYGRANFLIL